MKFLVLVAFLLILTTLSSAKVVDASQLLTAPIGEKHRFQVFRGDDIILVSAPAKTYYKLHVADIGDKSITFKIGIATGANFDPNPAKAKFRYFGAYTPDTTLTATVFNKEFIMSSHLELKPMLLFYLSKVTTVGEGWSNEKTAFLTVAPTTRDYTQQVIKQNSVACKPYLVNGDPKKKINVVIVPANPVGLFGYYPYKSEAGLKDDIKVAVDALFYAPDDWTDAKERSSGYGYLNKYKNDFNFYYAWLPTKCWAATEGGIFSGLRGKQWWNCDVSEEKIRSSCPNVDIVSVFIDDASRLRQLGTLWLGVPRSNSAGSYFIFENIIEIAGGSRVFAHELSHAVFGLSDEYCCDGGYHLVYDKIPSSASGSTALVWKTGSTSYYPPNNIYPGKCTELIPYIRKAYGIANFHTFGSLWGCQEFKDEDGEMWSRPYHKYAGDLMQMEDHEQSFDNLRVVECVISRLRKDTRNCNWRG